MEDDSETNANDGSSKSNVCCLLKRKSDVIEGNRVKDGDDHDQFQCCDNKSVKLDIVVSDTNKEIQRGECNVDFVSHCSEEDRSHYSLVVARHCTVDVESQYSVDGGNQCSVDDGNQCSVDDGNQCSVDDRNQCSIDDGNHCSFQDVRHSSEDVGSCVRVSPLVSNYTIVETMEENHECNMDKSKYCSTEQTNDCHAYDGRCSQTYKLIHTRQCDSDDNEITCKYKQKNDQLTNDGTEAIINNEKATDLNVNEMSECCEGKSTHLISNIYKAEDVENKSRYIDVYKSPSNFDTNSGVSIVVHEVSQIEKLSHLASVCSNSNKHFNINNEVILMTHNDEEDQKATDSQNKASTQTDFQSEETNVILINIIKRLQETISGPEVSNEEESKKSDEKSGKQYHQCTICNKVFQHKRSMKDHVNAHKGEKPYTCSICNESFSRRTSLQQHRSVHSDVKLHKCDICEKAFSRKYDLKNHQLVHTGEQPYKCELCIKSFKRRHGLNRHMLLHTQGNSYSCELCEVTFPRKSAFVKHQLLHEGNKVEA